MVFTGLRRAGGIALILAGLVVLMWGSWPARQITKVLPYSYGKELDIPAGWEDLQPPPSLANGAFSLEWPVSIRLGDEGKIRLSLEEIGSPSPCPTGVISSTFTLASRLELPGVSSSPGSELNQPIIPCRPVFQAWTIHSAERGNYAGTVWLHLVVIFLHADFDSQAPVAAIPVDFKVISLLGLSGPQARLLGVLAILIGLALNIDLLVRRT